MSAHFFPHIQRVFAYAQHFGIWGWNYMLQLNWSNSVSSKDRNLTVPSSPPHLHSHSFSLVQAFGSGSCHLLGQASFQARQKPACLSAVLGLWWAGSFRTRGARLLPVHPACNISMSFFFFLILLLLLFSPQSSEFFWAQLKMHWWFATGFTKPS